MKESVELLIGLDDSTVSVDAKKAYKRKLGNELLSILYLFAVILTQTTHTSFESLKKFCYVVVFTLCLCGTTGINVASFSVVFFGCCRH